MKNQMTAEETLQLFCRTWFEERDVEGTAAFFSDDVSFVGTGMREMAQGKEEMLVYLEQDIREIPEPFACILSIMHEQSITEEIRNLGAEMLLKNSQYTWHLRGCFILVREQEEWRIKSFHFAEPSSHQRGTEHYPRTLVVETANRQRQELLNDSLPGGMMGGYIEDGFPFYFVNRRMLEYLGYECEAEFLSDIDGLVSNCMHPDDRKMVENVIHEQLAAGEEYTVEYRMKKRDGSYIWVHDLGRRVKTEDGRYAAMSVCMDITDEKRLQKQIEEIYKKELSYFAELSSSDGSIQGSVNVTKDRLETYLSKIGRAHV